MSDGAKRKYREPWPLSWWKMRAARRAIVRCHGVPYLRELSRREHHGMLLLEGRGEVYVDDGDVHFGGGLHWHVR